MRAQVGFFDTPDKFSDRLEAIDRGVKTLQAQVNATPNRGALNDAWRAEFMKFVRRWDIERDTYVSNASRWFLLVPNARVQTFLDAYLWWAADFQRKSGKQLGGTAAKARESLTASVVPNQAWLIVGAAALLYAWASAKK